MEIQRFKRIFVVDDERLIAETLSIILGKSGYQTQFFVDPSQALEAARQQSPDLVISDVMMPQLTGVELAIAIRRSSPRCKILLFSGQAGTADLLSKAREAGHDFHLLTKPIHPDDLLREIRKEESGRIPHVYGLPV